MFKGIESFLVVLTTSLLFPVMNIAQAEPPKTAKIYSSDGKLICEADVIKKTKNDDGTYYVRAKDNKKGKKKEERETYVLDWNEPHGFVNPGSTCGTKDLENSGCIGVANCHPPTDGQVACVNCRCEYS